MKPAIASRLIALLQLILLSAVGNAQPFYSVTHHSGTQTIHGINVTVTTGPGTSYGSNCNNQISLDYGISPSSIASNYYSYAFSKPVSRIKIDIASVDLGETYVFHINGAHYTLTTANILPFPIAYCVQNTCIVNSGGDLGSTLINGTAEIYFNPGYPIDSFRASNPAGAGGSYHFSFSDTFVYIQQPFKDTILCVGDTMHIGYGISDTFKSNNIFTFQLSDLNGSFNSPILLGTVSSNISGIFNYVIPSSITPGNGYRIRVIASNKKDTSEDNGKNISIGIMPISKPIASSNTPVCAGTSLNLNANTTTSGVQWRWTGPNNFSSSLQTPQITNAQPIVSGQYVVTARLYGCLNRDTITVSVLPANGYKMVNSNAPICEGDTLKLTLNITGNSYSWGGPNGFSSSVKNPSITNAPVSSSGNYTIATAINGCVIYDTITVDVKPYASGRSETSNSPVCSNDTLKLTANSTSGTVNYLWMNPSSTTTNIQNPSIVNPTSGNYVVSYILNGCVVKDTVVVTVLTPPNTITASYNSPLCEADTLKLSSTNSSSGVTWGWAGSGSYTASVQNPIRPASLPAMSGKYYVTATAANGCKAKDSVDVTVKPLPANFSATSNTPICENNTVNLYGSTTSSSVTWAWSGPSFSS
ncbi:MAG: hypothetical protein JST82_06090, partial [Bacteroidetes bacterium]|nr:hypothetical protein [Bacteroidota bacterium]